MKAQISMPDLVFRRIILIISDNDNNYIFYERYCYKKRKGIISVYDINKEIHKDIIEEKLASTIPKDNIDNTQNKYGFIGNLKKPFNILVWLAAKAKPEKGTLPGYFFYQTREGFKFKAIDRLIEDGKRNPKATYEEIRFKESSKLGTDANDFSILSYDIVKNNDTFRVYNVHLQSIRLGVDDYSVFFSRDLDT
mgnify:CR=1 FL=1